MSTPLRLLLDTLEEKGRAARKSGSGWMARCPAHDDKTPSLSIGVTSDGKVLLKCFSGCDTTDIVRALGLKMRDLFPQAERRVARAPKKSGGAPDGLGCTLAEYSEAKKLPLTFLSELGVTEISYMSRPAVRILYRDRGGNEVATQFRVRLDKGTNGDKPFRWKNGSKTLPYGLWRLGDAEAAGFVVLVEGASDAQTLWHQGFPAVGIPGATTCRKDLALYLRDIPKIYVVEEPGDAGAAFARWLGESPLREKAWRLDLNGAKDPSEVFVRDPAGFPEKFRAILATARPWTELDQERACARRGELYDECADLANAPNILDLLVDATERMHVVGEKRAKKLLCLAITSRLLKKIVSIVLEGPSSAGKSFLVGAILKFFSPGAFWEVTAMSPKAIVYSEEPVQHRMLVICEAAGLRGGMGTYLLRSLLSENRIRLDTVEQTRDGSRPLVIEKEGPTGLISTTTAVRIDDEIATRLFRVPVDDSRSQTEAILLAAAEDDDSTFDYRPWHALQEWLETGTHEVVVPFARKLARLIPPEATRLRRDFPAVLGLIRAHALLHQATRDRDSKGRVIATIADYAVVRELVADLVAESAGTRVSETMRGTVEAVRNLQDPDGGPVRPVDVAKELGLDESTAWRRVRKAMEKGYLVNSHPLPRHYSLIPGRPIGEPIEILPTPEALLENAPLAATPTEVRAETDSNPNAAAPPAENGACSHKEEGRRPW